MQCIWPAYFDRSIRRGSVYVLKKYYDSSHFNPLPSSVFGKCLLITYFSNERLPPTFLIFGGLTMNNQFPMDFPYLALPGLIRETVLELQTSSQAPLPLVVSSVVGAVSLACQYSVDVRRPNGLESPSSLGFLTFLESGDRKSSVDKQSNKAIFEFESKQTEISKQLHILYESEMEVWDIERKAIWTALDKKVRKGESTDELKLKLAELIERKPKKPRTVKLVYNDTTPQALALGLYEKYPSAGLMSDEAGIIFDGKAVGNLGMISKLWEGATLTVDRLSSGSYTVKDPRLTISLMVQKNVFLKYFDRRGNEARGYGFFARLLVAAPISTQGTRFIYDQAPPVCQYLSKFHERVTEILNQNIVDLDSGTYSRTMLEFSPDAKARWIYAYNNIESYIIPGGYLSDVKDYASKMAENLARMAALFHFFEGEQGDISFETVDRAATVCAWYMDEFKRLFASGPEMSIEQTDAQLLQRWLLVFVWGAGHTLIKKNDVRQYGPNTLRNKVRLENALNYLIRDAKIWVGVDNRNAKFINLNSQYFQGFTSLT